MIMILITMLTILPFLLLVIIVFALLASNGALYGTMRAVNFNQCEQQLL